MLYLSNLNSRYECLEDNFYKIKQCNFFGLNENLQSTIGGAIYCSKENSFIYCIDCQFQQCSALTSGGIHIKKSHDIEISRICANSCSSTQGYSYFSYLHAEGSLFATLYSTHYCTGEMSTTCFSSSKICIENVNSTHNSGRQEPSFLLSDADFGSIKYAEVNSNEMKYIGMNYFRGKTYVSSHIHYSNCTLTNSEPHAHIFSDDSNATYIFDLYIEVDPEDRNYVISIANGATIYCHNIYVIGSNKIMNGVQMIENSLYTSETKTLIYSLLNTKLCPAIVNFEITNLCKKSQNTIINPKLFCTICLYNTKRE